MRSLWHSTLKVSLTNSCLATLGIYDQILGVDSVERSLQEDTLLVLFNTAISNLVRCLYPDLDYRSRSRKVLFRNNFAFSRDIGGLFQSFQSSASVLDPAANPSLFQSTLVIIIKVRTQ
jgi:hypothetical protein